MKSLDQKGQISLVQRWKELHQFWRGLILVMAGAWIGMVYLAHPNTVIHTVDHYHTKTVTQTKTVTVPKAPASCIAAMKLSKQLMSATSKVDSNADKFIDVIGNSRVAIEEGSVNKLNAAETTMQRYSDRNTGAIMAISNSKRHYTQLISQCEGATK